MTAHTSTFLALALVALLTGYTHARPDTCTVSAKTDAGYVCGLIRKADGDYEYASFRGVPYGKQPLGELRFKELEPVEPYEEYDARYEGPICYQNDVLYGKLMTPRGMSEACITANIHVPLEYLPNNPRIRRTLQPPRQAVGVETQEPAPGLPIMVFIHGGGFAYGSGDTDLHGPEYLVRKKVIIITFNYRLNVFGFLSLGTSKIPGNAGLRDMLTLLRWVKTNARAFGGNPDNVTLAGQSAGAIAAHLLSMSKAAEGLFKRAILMSGTAISGVYSPSKANALFLQKQLLDILAINTTDPDEIHQHLINLPAEKLHDADKILINQLGLTTFVPTIETSFPGITTVVENDPEVLLAKGAGRNIPLLVGDTNLECETFRRRLEEFNIVQNIKRNPFIIIPPNVLFTTLPSSLGNTAKKIDMRYYNGSTTVDNFVNTCTEVYFEYPVLKLAQSRQNKGASTFVYKFTYDNKNSVIRQAMRLNYCGAGHIEDLTYIFKANSVIGTSSVPPHNEDDMRNFMTNIVVNFINQGTPVLEEARERWPPVSRGHLFYQDINKPDYQLKTGPTSEQQNLIRFVESLKN